MIVSREPISMAEVAEYIKDNENSEELGKFIKKFTKLDEKEVEGLRKSINEAGIIKIKKEHVSKIIDVLPETAEDVNKIFADAGLDENEIQKILETTKEYAK